MINEVGNRLLVLIKEVISPNGLVKRKTENKKMLIFFNIDTNKHTIIYVSLDIDKYTYN